MKRIKEYQEIIKISNDPASTTSIVKPLGISLGVMLFQQTTGINVIVFADDIFQAVGSTMNEKYATIIVGAVQLVFTIASGFLVRHSLVG